MKAKKTNPKSIRFNLKHLELALLKSKLDTYQELVDFLLEEYIKENKESNSMDDERVLIKNKLRKLIIDILD